MQWKEDFLKYIFVCPPYYGEWRERPGHGK
jgi:hypothetical protein